MDLYESLLHLLGIKGGGPAYADLVKRRILSAYDCARSISSEMDPGSLEPPIATLLSKHPRAWLAAVFDEICSYASSDAAVGMAVGYSTRLLSYDDDCRVTWLGKIPEPSKSRLLRLTVQIAGIRQDIHSTLAERLGRAEDLLGYLTILTCT